MFECFVHVVFEMTEAIGVRGVGEQRLYSFDKTLLSIRKKDEIVIHEVMECMGLDDISEVLKKQKPVRIVFGIYNGVSKREQRTISVNSGSSKKNA